MAKLPNTIKVLLAATLAVVGISSRVAAVVTVTVLTVITEMVVVVEVVVVAAGWWRWS